jgi:hypothetical protein
MKAPPELNCTVSSFSMLGNGCEDNNSPLSTRSEQTSTATREQ